MTSRLYPKPSYGLICPLYRSEWQNTKQTYFKIDQRTLCVRKQQDNQLWVNDSHSDTYAIEPLIAIGSSHGLVDDQVPLP
jgi:hypothetical protein